MIKLSVIIPIYNVEEYIVNCIQSVYNQNLDDNEFEIILVDDESPDNSLQLAKSVTRSFNNVKIISQKNKGLGGARNTGIKLAEGRYVLFLDSDDWYLKNSLDYILAIALKNDTEILEFGAQLIDTNKKLIKRFQPDNRTESVIEGIDYKKSANSINSACNKLYNREFLINNDLWFSEKIYAEDLEFNTRAFFLSKRVMSTNYIVASFLQQPNSITRSKDQAKKDKYISDLISILLKIKTFRLKHELITVEKHNFYFNEKMTSICIGIFQELFKNNASYGTIKIIQQKLIKEDIYYTNHKILNRKRNIFRKYVVGYNFLLFRLFLFQYGIKKKF
ncbi:glycosyltransferase family 2 protein [Gaetbulibacter aestuarii]|uniref:Glycosyltransferase n=1 Tax=Gaetbulibacter aestuarii TaxID=1502358 RepID=A0ABW7N3A3_9FLAO